jgi:hypothetical protein
VVRAAQHGSVFRILHEGTHLAAHPRTVINEVTLSSGAAGWMAGERAVRCRCRQVYVDRKARYRVPSGPFAYLIVVLSVTRVIGEPRWKPGCDGQGPVIASPARSRPRPGPS